MDLLATFHSLFRWVVLVAMVGTGLWGLWAGRRGSPWRERPYVLAAVSLDVQAATGILLWLGQQAWATRGFFIGVIHPLAMIGSVALAHVAVARGRRAGGPGGHRLAGGGMLLALVVVILAIPRWAWF